VRAGESVKMSSANGGPARPRSSTSYTFSPGVYSQPSLATSDEDQVTPRASLSNPSTQTEVAPRGLSRDDTARDVSMFSPSASQEQLPPGQQSEISHHRMGHRWNSVVNDNAVSLFGQQEGAAVGTSSGGSTTFANQLKSNPKQVRSLGRRISKKYAETLTDIRAGFNIHAPGRSRGASTPQHNEPIATTTGAHREPLSPAKRNGSSAWNGPRKYWKSQDGDSVRKDTPAPPAPSNKPQLRPNFPAASVRAPWQLGGEGARKAAAAAKNFAGPLFEHAMEDHELALQQDHIRQTRSRIGSLNSAADSGADLSNYDDQSREAREDSVADVDEMDIDEEDENNGTSSEQDFVKNLPQEMVLNIFEFLEAKDLLRAQLAKRSWYEMIEEPSIWRTAYMRRFGRQIFTDPPPIQVGGVGIGRTGKPNQEWKKMYEARLELERNWRPV
jgi:F-box and WD-40 domain protein 1/11